MTLWKQRLFYRLQRPFDDDGSDLGGEVISVNGEGTAEDAQSSTPEDRGDVVASPDTEQEDTGSRADEPRQSGAIPKARFDEVNEKRKNAEAELERANAELAALHSKPATPAPVQNTSTAQPEPVAPEFDEDGKEQAYIEALLDGDTAKAASIRKEINANLRIQAATEVETRNSTKQIANELQAASTQALEAYPYLDTPDGEFALDLIVTARNQAIARGESPARALSNAVAMIAPRFAPANGSTPSPVLPKGKPAVDTRTQEAIARGAADSLTQPPNVQASGIGNRADAVRVDVANLDEEQFANLSAADKKRLRGD
jgi:hypothetical protein